ncbi:organic hydroperoxide resistance protein [Ectothiorhodospiraceae bacterium WFHF3C12]|nr:organic hydroperoxide resistance protein [Ectothiorhodospiraceae bacterium WFHF3C12]
MKALYTTTATARGGRTGHVRSEDGLLEHDLALPEALGGQGGATNPEQLFAAGYAACFENALAHVAGNRKVGIEDTEVTAEVGIGQRPEGGFGLIVALEVKLGGVDATMARSLVDTAHEVCPYSHAVNGNIQVDTRVTPR